jgi:hypothetical protein
LKVKPRRLTISSNRETEVNSQLSLLSGSVAILREELTALCDRLKPVLRSESPETADKTAPEPQLCPLADNLRAIRGDVEHLRDAIQRHRARIEL